MQQIRFRDNNTVPQISLAQGGYQRTFVRDKQPFPLHDEPHWAEFEQRFIPTHEYLELVEVEDPPVNDAPTTDDASQTGEEQTEAAPANATEDSSEAPPATSETIITESPAVAVSALKGNKKKN